MNILQNHSSLFFEKMNKYFILFIYMIEINLKTFT
jgi:hypothetical protein